MTRCPECGGTLCRERTLRGYRAGCAYCPFVRWTDEQGRPVDAPASSRVKIKVARMTAGGPCEVRGCATPSKCVGLCSKHRERWRTCGEPDRGLWLAAGGPTKKDWQAARKLAPNRDNDGV